MLRDKFLAFSKNDDERMMLSRIYDCMQSAENNYTVKTTQFLNGHELSLVQKALGKSNCVCFSAYGGYDEAERKVICFYPNYLSPQYNIRIIEVSGREIEHLSHRDYLGSLLALGIRREKIGDIIINEKNGYIFCLEDISQYIITQLEKIANKAVKLQICDQFEVIIPQKKFKEISATVSSLRLDSIVSAGINVSRSVAASLIKSGKLTIDWEQTENISFLVKENQIISIKGFGRMELAHVRGETKKGRIAITIKRFI